MHTQMLLASSHVAHPAASGLRKASPHSNDEYILSPFLMGVPVAAYEGPEACTHSVDSPPLLREVAT
jgi:hypothetical protein